LDEVLRIKEQLERMSYQMADDMRQIKSKMDTQSVDLVSVVNELKHKTKRLEDDHRQQVSHWQALLLVHIRISQDSHTNGCTWTILD
jgi:hypothetical protein